MSVSKIGRYELRHVLARTPSSTVYEGWDELIARKVAVKIVPVQDRNDVETHDLLSRFSRGARAAGMLNHPNIVALYDYGETEDSAYLVMEFIDGTTLKALLEKTSRLAPKAILPIMDDVSAALTYSHGRGVVHRDIKPANLMMLADGHVKITDFGVARIENSSLTQTGTIIGTPAYMSPEQFRGELVNSRTDIYSMGVVLYQMLTGHRPYEGSLATIAHKVLHTEPTPPSQVAIGFSPAFDPVVRRAMAKHRDDRYATAHDLALAVHEAAAAADPSATIARPALSRPAPTPSSAHLSPLAPRKGRRRGIDGLVILAGAALGVAIGVVALWPSGKPSSPGQAPAQPAPQIKAQASAAQPPAATPLADQPAVQTATAATPPPDVPPRPPPADVPAHPPPSLPTPTPQLAVSPSPPLAVHLPDVVPPVPRHAPPPPPNAPRPPAQRLASLGMPVPPPVAPAAPRPLPTPDIKPAASTERSRVYLYYPANSEGGQRLSTELAKRLLFSDFNYADTRSSGTAPPESEIRYFHSEDQNAAMRLAALLNDPGQEFRIRDVSNSTTSRPRGALEVWIGR